MNGFEELYGPLATMGFGGLAGAVTGYAAKKVAKMVALALGVIFITIQLLAYMEWITVDWGAVQASADPLLHDRSYANQAWDVLTANLPFGGGFIAGFAIGFRMG